MIIIIGIKLEQNIGYTYVILQMETITGAMATE